MDKLENKLNLFMQLCKVDEAQRLVSGILSAEVVDKSNEIMDYDTGKAEFEKWSKEAHKRSDGKSLGNVREMHDNKACGKLTQMICDDATKTIQGTAKIVDDAAWNKVLEGVYTGFSIGGEYAKKWKDEANPAVTRFTPTVAEVSIVDNPCVAEAVFELIRSDGSKEMRKFKSAEPNVRDDKTLPLSKRYAGVTAPEQSQKWLAKDGTPFDTKELAYAHNATLEDPALQLLEKMHQTLDKLENQVDPMTLGKKDFSDDERKKLAESGAAMEDGSFPIESKEDLHNAIQAHGRAKDKEKAKAHIITRAKALGATEELPENWHEDGKTESQEEPEKAVGISIKKGLADSARVAFLIQELEWIEEDQPDEIKAVISKLNASLKDACEKNYDIDPEIASALPEDHARAMSKVVATLPMIDAKETEKVKKFSEFKSALAKAGARHSKADMEALNNLQGKHEEMEGHMDKMKKALNDVEDAHDDIHATHRAMGKCFGKAADTNMDNIKEKHGEMAGQIKKAMAAHGEAEDIQSDMEDTHAEMGKCMDYLGSSEKAAAAVLQKDANDETTLLKAENTKLSDTVTKLTDGLDGLMKRLQVIEKQPQAAKGVLYAVPKGHELEAGKEPPETIKSEPDRTMIGRI
jgi:hypothetical protein